MSTELETVETATEQNVETDLSARLQQSAFAPETMEATIQAATTATEQSTTPAVETTTTTTEQTVTEPFYKSLGLENEDAVVNEIKTLREKKPDTVEFKDETTRQLYELLLEGGEKKKEAIKILKEQEQIEELATLTVDKDNAAEIIKLQMKLKNKQLSKEEIDFEYKEKFVAPKEPVQRISETDEEFEERTEEWKEKVSVVEQRRVIAAKLAQPELNSLKSELSLPTITTNEQTQNAPTEEQIKAHKADVEAFVKTVDVSFNDFKGFSTNVKDKDVDFAVGYDLSDDEKAGVKQKLQQFAENGFNTNDLLQERWVIKNADGSNSLNTPQMVKDLSRMLYGEMAESKIASKAANERMEQHLKLKKNIDLGTSTGNNQPVQLNNQQAVSQKLQEAAFGVPQ